MNQFGHELFKEIRTRILQNDRNLYRP